MKVYIYSEQYRRYYYISIVATAQRKGELNADYTIINVLPCDTAGQCCKAVVLGTRSKL